jgi:hypothetical protein
MTSTAPQSPDAASTGVCLDLTSQGTPQTKMCRSEGNQIACHFLALASAAVTGMLVKES